MGNHVYIWELAWVFEKRLKICGKWRRSVGNVSNMWGNDLIIWQTAYKRGKWLRDLGNGQNIWEMA